MCYHTHTHTHTHTQNIYTSHPGKRLSVYSLKFTWCAAILKGGRSIFVHIDIQSHDTSVKFSQDGHCQLVSSLDNNIRLLDKDSAHTH